MTWQPMIRGGAYGTTDGIRFELRIVKTGVQIIAHMPPYTIPGWHIWKPEGIKYERTIAGDLDDAKAVCETFAKEWGACATG